MPRHTTSCLLAIILLSVEIPALSAAATKVLSDEVCQAPFVLSVPAEVIRANRGLVIVMHDDGAGQRLVFDVGLRGVIVRLRREGKVTELARAVAPLPGTGGMVVFKRLQSGFAVAYDGNTVLRGKADLPDGGHWGVVGAPAGVLDKILMQPIDKIAFSDDFMRTPDEPTVWENLSGRWRIAQLASARYSANAFTLLGSASEPKPALTTAGYWFWEDLTVEASVRPSPGASGFGIGLGCQSGKQAYLLRFMSRVAPAGVVQLVRVRGGRESVLAEARAVARPDDWHRFALSGVGGRLTGALNGVELVTAQAPDLAHGKIALWVTGSKAVAFDDVEAYSGPRDAQKPVVLSHQAQSADPSAQAFIGDQYMQEWADERDQWLPGVDGVWHAGYYWGDVALSWELPEGGLWDTAQLHICVPAGADTFGHTADTAAGCHLDLARAADGQLTLTLREGQQPRVQKTVAMPAPPCTVTLRRVGKTVEALVGSEAVASFEAAVPAAGKVGLSAPTARSQAGRLGIVSHNLIDSTFRSAPTDWTIGSGEWGVSSRWACTPRWSWFQGRAEDLASIWTRRRFTGDVVVEFFAGIPMDQPWAPFYRHPGNLAVTLAGSDGTPGSGYSLVFAGWGNSASGIFRRGELVAKVPGFVMPDILDSLGGTADPGEAHKLHDEWWRIRAERIGRTVRLLVDGKVAASYDDPEPLPGGAVGIWTLNQAITVARARVYYETGQDVLPPVPSLTTVHTRSSMSVPPSSPPRLVTTFEQGLGGWRPSAPGSCVLALAQSNAPSGGLCLEAVNPTAGGSFAMAAPCAGVDLRTHPLLAFDYAIPANVHIDVFATVGGQRYRLALSGPKDPAPGIEDVGRVADARADGSWHTAQVDLLGLMGPYFPAQAPIALQALEFAAYAAPEYMRAGIGGNPAHASWRLDNFHLGGVSSAAVGVTAKADTRPPNPPTPIGTPAAQLDCDFEANLGPIKPWGVDAAVALRRAHDPVAGHPGGGEWCLEARSTKLGGLFGVSLGVTPFEASRYPVLEFDYRVPRELRVDLIAEVDGSRRVIKFTDNDQTWPVIGRVGAVADDHWHRATVDLHGLLASAFGRSAPLVVTNLAFASSGWPGNRYDTRWWLDNIRLSAAVNVNHLPVDTEPPVASSPWPANGASACPRAISVKITDMGSGVSPADLRLTINGRTWTVADEALSWNAASGQLTWSLQAGLSLGANGSRVSCRLAATDLAGNALLPLEWAFTLDYALDREPPAAPVVSYVPARRADGNEFETGTGGWGNFWGCQVLRLAQGGTSGPGCAELRHLGGQEGGSCFALVRDFGESWRQFPMLRFRYRAVNAPHASLQVFGTTFNGDAEEWTPLGTFPISGGEWLSAELDLAQALRQTNPSLNLHRIFLSVALPPDGALRVDDYAMYSEAATRAAFHWAEPASRSGITGYSWVLDSSDDTLPLEKVRGSARYAEFTGLKPGRYVFHVRARDGAGNWGPASRVSIRLAEPVPPAKSAGQR